MKHISLQVSQLWLLIVTGGNYRYYSRMTGLSPRANCDEAYRVSPFRDLCRYHYFKYTAFSGFMARRCGKFGARRG